MKNPIALFISVACVALMSASLSIAQQSTAQQSVAQQRSKPEASMLPASEYRKPLDEIIVEGQKPYWQGEAAPRWDRSKVEAPKPDEANKSRLQWAPDYTRDERDDYMEPRDQVNPKPRAKIFELKF